MTELERAALAFLADNLGGVEMHRFLHVPPLPSLIEAGLVTLTPGLGEQSRVTLTDRGRAEAGDRKLTTDT
jgi:hypothetical protein